jgi:hypothetical protein
MQRKERMQVQLRMDWHLPRKFNRMHRMERMKVPHLSGEAARGRFDKKESVIVFETATAELL